MLRRLTDAGSQATVDRVVDGLVSVSGSPSTVRQLGRNLLVDEDFLRTVPDMSQELFEQVFTVADIGSLPREARSLLVSSGTSSVDAIRLQNRFRIEIRPTAPWGPPPTASATSANEIEVAELLHSQVDETGRFANRLEFAEEAGTTKLDISGELPPRDQLRLEAIQRDNPDFRPQDLPDTRNPEYLQNGQWVDVFTPEGDNQVLGAIQKVTVLGQTQRVTIVVRGEAARAEVVAAWNSLLEEVADLPGPRGEIFGFTQDPSRFPLEELTVIDLDAADPVASIVRLFPDE